MASVRRQLAALGVLLALALALASCGGGKKDPAEFASFYPTKPAPPTKVVARVGATPITGALYNHWLVLGIAAVERGRNGGLPAKPFVFEPPLFTACIVHMTTARPALGAAKRKATCATEYATVKANALTLLITGDWVREYAAAHGVSITEAEVKQRLREEIKQQFGAPGSFHKFQESSLESEKDLMFGIESQMLNKTLFEKFGKEPGHGKTEKAKVSAYEAAIEKWKAKTFCQPGYVVKVCG